MISVDEALARCFALVSPLGTETVPLRAAAGRVMAEPAIARRDQPPFAASSMDGYALGGDPVAGDRFTVVGEAGAGHEWQGRLAAGHALRIFTGAPVPEGATRVVIQEDVDTQGSTITIRAGADNGTHIRPAGQDFRTGDPGKIVIPGHQAAPSVRAISRAMV